MDDTFNPNIALTLNDNIEFWPLAKAQSTYDKLNTGQSLSDEDNKVFAAVTLALGTITLPPTVQWFINMALSRKN